MHLCFLAQRRVHSVFCPLALPWRWSLSHRYQLIPLNFKPIEGMSYSVMLNCNRGLYCIFSNFWPPKLFYNDPPILPKCEIRTYSPHILLSTSHIRIFLISQETENFYDKTELFLKTKSKSKYQGGPHLVLTIFLKQVYLLWNYSQFYF